MNNNLAGNFNVGIGNNVNGNKNALKLDLKLILKILIVVNLVIICFLAYKFFNLGSITLIGDENITIYLNDNYIDPGYKGYDSKGNDITDKVIVTNNVDSSMLGEYDVIYTMDSITKTRHVKVVEPKALEATTFILLTGDDIIYLKQHDNYIDPGYTVIDSKTTNLDESVTVSGEVDTENPGTYKLVYSVINTDNVTISASRTVVVIGSHVTYTISPDEFTKDKVTINLLIDNNYMEYVLLPNKEKSEERALSYTVSKNDKYKFTIYSKNDIKEETVINVTNIDNEKPTVNSCTVELVNSQYQISANASDKAGIKSYAFYVDGKEIKNGEENKYSFSGDVKDPYVIVSDMVGNSTKKECTIINNVVSAKILGNALPTDMIDKAQISTFKDGKVLENYTYKCDDNTQFYTTAVSKMMLGVIAAKMLEDGYISMDYNVNKYWKDLENKEFSSNSETWKAYVANESTLRNELINFNSSHAKNFSLRNLLTHSSSIKNNEYAYINPDDLTSEYVLGSVGKSYDSAIKVIKNSSIFGDATAGTRSNYNYLNDSSTREHALAGFTMQIILNKSLNEYLRQSVLSKLGTNSNPSFIEGNSIYFATGYKSSANDLAMIAAAISNNGVYNGKTIFGTTAINNIKKVESNLNNQTIAFDYKDKKYMKYGIFSDIEGKENYGLIEVINNYTSFVILDFDTKSGFAINMKLKSSSDKEYAFNIFNSISSYFYS